MAVDHGWDGSIMVGATTIAFMTEWTLEMTADALERTAFGDTFDRAYLSGLRSHTVSFSGYSDDADAGQLAVLAEMTTSLAPAQLTLKMMTNNNAGGTSRGYQLTIVLTGITRSAAPDALQTFSANGQGTGLLTTI